MAHTLKKEVSYLQPQDCMQPIRTIYQAQSLFCKSGVWGTELAISQINCSRCLFTKDCQRTSTPLPSPSYNLSCVHTRQVFHTSENTSESHKSSMQIVHMTTFLVNLRGGCQSHTTQAQRGVCAYMAVKNLAPKLPHQMLQGLLKTR